MPVCKYFNKPGGCRQGDQCKFSHSQTQQQNLSQPSSWRRGGRASPTGSHPPGVCKNYWSTGECKFGFSCRFKHETPSSSRATQPLHPNSASSLVANFLTGGGLKDLNGMATDVFFPSTDLNPEQTHNHLVRFLLDHYRFKNVHDIYGFVAVLNNVSAKNSLWTMQDGQSFLQSLVTGNGMLRIAEILQWPEVSIRAGHNNALLSFQRGTIGLLGYFASEFVVKSTLNHIVNALYAIVMENFDHISDIINKCMSEAMEACSFQDPAFPLKDSYGIQIISSLATVFFECLTRFKNAVATHPQLVPIVHNLVHWNKAWTDGITASPPTFEDNSFKNAPLDSKGHLIRHLSSRIRPLVSIVDREQKKAERSRNKLSAIPFSNPETGEAIISALEMGFVGPGNLRPSGPRHDNDAEDIREIRIAPTHQELISRLQPYLPANFYGAPHHLPSGSMERLLDIQFRLLREELTAPIRTSIGLVRHDILEPSRKKTRLSDILASRGGRYQCHDDMEDSVMFFVYTGVTFGLIAPDRRGVTVDTRLDTPPGRARSSQASVRANFWKGVGGKRLVAGGLVALIWKSGPEVDVHLGILANSPDELIQSAKSGNDCIKVRIAFFDAAVELRILSELKDRRPKTGKDDIKILLEAPSMFEAVRPFLEALRIDPELIPLSRYLVHQPPNFFSHEFQIHPPQYATVPGFSYQVSSLFPTTAGVEDLQIVVQDPQSIEFARQEMKRASRLDSSQVDAVVDTLTREVALIQGPPGTGKSYTGVELIRVFLANRVRPILMIAFTNHALDHMLCSVLDAGITTSIVRLGSRSTDERISKFSMENLENVAGKDNRSFGHQHREWKKSQENLSNLLFKSVIHSNELVQYLEIRYPKEASHIHGPPRWVLYIWEQECSDKESGTWQRAGPSGQGSHQDHSVYAFWKDGRDLDFLQQLLQPQSELPERTPAHGRAGNKFAVLANDNGRPYNGMETVEVDISDTEMDTIEADPSDTESDEPLEERWVKLSTTVERSLTPDLAEEAALSPSEGPLDHIDDSPPTSGPSNEDIESFFRGLECSEIPYIPLSDRPISDLLNVDNIWLLSRSERKSLHDFWETEISRTNNETLLKEFETLRDRHAEALRNYNETKDETRRQLLQRVDIIGCTTTGAAKLTGLLRGIGPRVMLAEEAGQVLEAHILGSLVPSIEHLVLIGDPLQLRPTLNNFSLSVDSKRGARIYRFDMSLMERLAQSGLPMSRLDVQRRMRPTISSLIRTTLYPGLIDNDRVKKYPSVRGLAKNVFFFTHHNKENGGAEESMSKFNAFEVDMVKDLVLYLLRQGCYSQEGDIVVLCAYLGQLAKVRDALANEVAVVIDDRDQMALAEREDGQESELDSAPAVERVRITTRVRLRTVDNYQGEEAKIVVLTLVRNSGRSESTYPSIGFLKSDNRTNVAISRAKEGLFILGNAADLSCKSSMWHSIISQLEEEGAVGKAFPIACHRHQDMIKQVSKPGQLCSIAPDGGCLLACDAKLKCGHRCPYKCHPDDPNHVSVRCDQICSRLCTRNHPCEKRCGDPCGKCSFPMRPVKLPCGHVKSEVPCHLMESLAEVYCDVAMTRQLPNCEHFMEMACSADVGQQTCRSFCSGILRCCGRDCKSLCHECQHENNRADDQVGPTPRINHRGHPCEKVLYCGHTCGKMCSENHVCNTSCDQQCQQKCTHTRCKLHCSTPCAPCLEPCTWKCPHFGCLVPCGSICARLPCDIRCNQQLKCGHRCPSVCGEMCSAQICPICIPESLRENVVDFILQRTLSEVDVDLGTLDELLITLPDCLHVFTIETLDGHCKMHEYYNREGPDGPWTSLKDPPPGFKQPPTCPTCRTPITSPRYGRVFKRAGLDILENNLASDLSKVLGDVQQSVWAWPKQQRIEELSLAAATIKFKAPKKVKKVGNAQKAFLKSSSKTPAPPPVLQPANHGVAQPVCEAWSQRTKPLIEAYSRASNVAAARRTHLAAWESAFSSLYRHEIELAVENPAVAPRHPKEFAMQAARLSIGQPKPLAEQRYRVEAFWVTLQIRFLLVEVAQSWLKSAHKNTSYPDSERLAWAKYILFLLHSCSRDAKMAFEIAESSNSRRQMTTTSVQIMQAELEQFRFNVEMERSRKDAAPSRDHLLQLAIEKGLAAKSYAKEISREHVEVLKSPGEREWLKARFVNPAMTIIDEWDALELSIRGDTFYQPVSLEEKIAIVRAFGFSHTGHFYNCPNGHTFVIGECGGAMESSTCPECGESIGGSNHSLNSTNTHAMDMENIARGLGSNRSPWAWGA